MKIFLNLNFSLIVFIFGIQSLNAVNKNSLGEKGNEESQTNPTVSHPQKTEIENLINGLKSSTHSCDPVSFNPQKEKEIHDSLSNISNSGINDSDLYISCFQSVYQFYFYSNNKLYSPAIIDQLTLVYPKLPKEQFIKGKIYYLFNANKQSELDEYALEMIKLFNNKKLNADVLIEASREYFESGKPKIVKEFLDSVMDLTTEEIKIIETSGKSYETDRLYKYSLIALHPQSEALETALKVWPILQQLNPYSSFLLWINEFMNGKLSLYEPTASKIIQFYDESLNSLKNPTEFSHYAYYILNDLKATGGDFGAILWKMTEKRLSTLVDQHLKTNTKLQDFYNDGLFSFYVYPDALKQSYLLAGKNSALVERFKEEKIDENTLSYAPYDSIRQHIFKATLLAPLDKRDEAHALLKKAKEMIEEKKKEDSNNNIKGCFHPRVLPLISAIFKKYQMDEEQLIMHDIMTKIGVNFNTVDVNLALHNYTEAEKLLDEDPIHSTRLDTRIYLAYKQGQYEKALTLLRDKVKKIKGRNTSFMTKIFSQQYLNPSNPSEVLSREDFSPDEWSKMLEGFIKSYISYNDFIPFE